MELNEYQKRAMTTCMETCDNFSYMLLNLVGEIGEFAGKVAKHIRKDKALIDYNHLITEKGANVVTDEEMVELMKEAGDVLWQLSGLCTVMGWTLDDVAQMNLEKLASRKAAGTIDGNGDGVTAEERGVISIDTDEVPVEEAAKPVKSADPEDLGKEVVKKAKKFYRKRSSAHIHERPPRGTYRRREALVNQYKVSYKDIYDLEQKLGVKAYRYGHNVYYTFADSLRLEKALKDYVPTAAPVPEPQFKDGVLQFN